MRFPRQAVLMLVCSMVAGAGEPNLADWEWVYPRPQGSSLNDVCHGDARFVAVGDNGAVVTSPDGVQWATRLVHHAPRLTRVAFGNHRFVAASQGTSWQNGRSSTLISLDGSEWSTTANDLPAIADLTFAAGSFYISTLGGEIHSSTDGVHWTIRRPADSSNPGPLAFGSQGLLTFVGNRWEKSTDGTAWEPAGTNTFISQVSAIEVFRGKYLAAIGNPPSRPTLVPSDDGRMWSAIPNGSKGEPVALAASEKCAIAVGTGTDVQRTVDGLVWTSSPHRLPNERLRAVTFGGNVFVAVGAQGLIATSADGVAWTTKWQPLPGTRDRGLYLLEMAARSNLVVAIGSGIDSDLGAIFGSTNGTDWSQLFTTTNSPASVAYGGGRFVAVGAHGAALTSEDGLQWVESITEVSSNFTGICHGNSRFMAVGAHGDSAWSHDGLAWVPMPTVSSSLRFRDVCADDRGFVAVGQNARGQCEVLSWRDSGPWIVEATLPLGPNSIAYGNRRYVISSIEENLWVSENRKEWSKIRIRDLPGPISMSPSSPTPHTVAPLAPAPRWGNSENRVRFGLGRFWYAGGDRVATSADGLTWASRLLPSGLATGALVHDGRLIVSLYEGVLRSGRLGNPSLTAARDLSGGTRLRIDDLYGEKWLLESAIRAEGADWEAVNQVAEAPDGSVSMQVPWSKETTARFFRLRRIHP